MNLMIKKTISSSRFFAGEPGRGKAVLDTDVDVQSMCG